jgi:hypothetical protein
LPRQHLLSITPISAISGISAIYTVLVTRILGVATSELLELLMTVVYPVLDVIVMNIGVLCALMVTREASAAATLERVETSEQRQKQGPLQPHASR